eukprot:GGOE01004474.1.p1 GENE.GGOE01004474.1~~GGOE01004474.1.p1  ORF type:complete len:524 (-),score=136.23 GGOE01004474.1:265-1809(-)
MANADGPCPPSAVDQLCYAAQKAIEDLDASSPSACHGHDTQAASSTHSANLPFPIEQQLQDEGPSWQTAIERPERQPTQAGETEEEREERELQSALAFRERWQRKKKHIFVFSNAGKPIFSRYGDESDISDFFGVMQALVSFVIDSDDMIQRLVAGSHQFVFSLHGPLYFVVVAATLEPFAALARQLRLMHSQIVFHLTGNVARIFEKRAGFDLRHLLGGTDSSVRSLVRNMNNSPAYILNAVQCLPMAKSDRTAIGEIMRDAKCDRQLFAILIAGDYLVQVVTPQRQPIHPMDLLLLINYVTSTASLRVSTNFSPICLPKFQDSGMVYAYIDFIGDANTLSGPVGICLILVCTSPDPERFAELDHARQVIVDQLTSRGLLGIIHKQVQVPLYSAQELGLPTLCHMLYKSSSSQYSATCYGPPYSLSGREQRRLLRLYSYLKQRVCPSRARNKLCYHSGTHALSVVAVTKDYELYTTHHLMTSKLEVLASCHKIRRWIKMHEDYLFIMHSPFWQ